MTHVSSLIESKGESSGFEKRSLFLVSSNGVVD